MHRWGEGRGDIKQVALKREARRGRFSNLEQLLEVRAARGEDNLVSLETPTTAGKGDIDEVLVISEGFELAGDVSLKVVPTQAKLLLTIRHSPRSTPFDLLCRSLFLSLSLKLRTPHHPPSIRLSFTFTFFYFYPCSSFSFLLTAPLFFLRHTLWLLKCILLCLFFPSRRHFKIF